MCGFRFRFVKANKVGLARSYSAVCLLRPLWSACGATQAGCGGELAVRLLQRTSTHETISSSIEPLLLLSGANYLAHRSRLRQQSDASFHLFDGSVSVLS